MTARARIDAALDRAFYWKTVFAAGRTAARALSYFFAAGLAVWAFDAVHPLSPAACRALWGAVFAGSLLAAMRDLRPDAWRRRALAADVGRALRPSDLLVNGWELARRPADDAASAELMELHLRKVDEELRRVAVGRLLRPADWRASLAMGLSAAAAAAALFLSLPESGRASLARIYYPFGAGETWISIEPGDLDVPSGADVPVRVAPSRRGADRPQLWVKAGALTWEQRPLEPSGARFTHLFQDVLEPIAYKVRHRGRWTPVYRITPHRAAEFKSLRIEARFPAYTGKAPETFENTLVTRVLRGASLRFRGRLDRRARGLSAVSADGRAWPVRLEDGTDAAMDLDVFESAEVRIEIDEADVPPGARASVVWRIEVEDDRPPSVRVLAPAQDLEAAADDELPLTYEASDDFGLAETFLDFKVNDGPYQRAPLRRFSASDGAVRQTVQDHVWRLRELGLRAGDAVEYYLSAHDNNTLSGAGRGSSAVFRVRVASYEEEHAALEADLEKVRQDLLKSLGEESLVQDALAKPAPDWARLGERQSALNRRVADAAVRMKELAERLRGDPLADGLTAEEHDAIARNLFDLEADALRRASGGISAKNAGEAGRAAGEAVAELERLSLLAEDALQAGRMRKVLDDQDAMTAAVESLREEMAAGGAMTAEQARKWRQAMEEVARLAEQIAEQVRKFPQELPEDFVNQEGVKTLRLDEARQLAAEIQKALAQGDAAGALARMERLAETLRAMRDTLRRAGENVRGGPSWADGALKREMDQRRDELEELVRRQEALKTKTEGVSAAALAGILEREKEILRAVGKDQLAWRDDFAAFEKSVASSFDPYAALESRPRLARVAALMETVHRELAALRLQETPQALEDSAAQLDETRRALEQASERFLSSAGVRSSTAAASLPAPLRRNYEALASLRGTAARLAEGLRARQSALRARPAEKDFLSEADRRTAASAAVEQEALRTHTLEFRRRANALAQKTALLGGRFLRRLALAAEEMGAARESLEKLAARAAVSHQENALNHLRESGEEMSSASQTLSGLGAGGGAASSLRGAASGGAVGSRTAPVRIPRADEYRPSREFREEILKSMKENYPKSYEGTVQDYYNQWAK